jgi:hypothetical protein
VLSRHSCFFSGKKLQLGWRQDEHQGFIDLQWLRELKDYRELKPEPFEVWNYQVLFFFQNFFLKKKILI